MAPKDDPDPILKNLSVLSLNMQEHDKTRLQLIASVLASLNVYWVGVFLIPKNVVKDTDKALKGFLWCKGEIKRGKAKVKWETVCSPKSHGGLGLRIFGKWNEILLMKNLWNITEDRNTMWVNVVKLRGKSLWEVQKEANDSWMWKCLLELRCKIRQNIFKVLGDGKGTNFWFDQWNSKGTLSEIISRKDVYAAMLVGNESVWDMIEDNKWRCPNGWILKYPIQGRFMDFGGPLPSPQRGP
nr:RNA-directed DNA polymerase, eukaryota, reverse transcriptase zinc-binding domain protein [Tanacetum cinerariifolium]